MGDHYVPEGVQPAASAQMACRGKGGAREEGPAVGVSQSLTAGMHPSRDGESEATRATR